MSSFLDKLKGALGNVAKYLPLAIAAVAQVQAEVGASNGDPATQQSKRATAIAYVLAAAHAGESVPVPVVQAIASAVDMAAGMAKALGLFGKTTAPAATVPIPPAA